MGSPNGIWTSVSGAIAQNQNVDTISNNIANSHTTGFKKDSPSFKEYLTSIERPPSVGTDIPQTIFKDSDFYHFDGREHAMVNVDKIHTDHTAGPIRTTGAPFDLALEGPGFITVQTPNGLMYTRAGDLKVSAQGQLVTSDGYLVMALGGEAEAAKNEALSGGQAQQNQQPQAVNAPPKTPTRNIASINPFSPSANEVAPAGAQPLLKPIRLSDAILNGQKIKFNGDGRIYAGEEQIGVLALAEFVDSRLLKKEASTAFSNPNPANVPRISMKTKVHQGFLEGSNVNPVGELVDLIKANRMFESNMKAIKSYSDMAQKEANEVGKL